MVQRMSQLDKQYTKDKKEKSKAQSASKKKRELKVEAKRDANNKEARVNRYKKAQGGRNFGGSKRGGKK